MQRIASSFAIFGATCLAGCASIVSKSEWPVTIASNPPGASVSIRNNSGQEIHKGTTPTTLTLSSRGGYFSPAKYTVAFEKDGFVTSSMPMNSHLNGWYWGNIVFGGLIGMLIVDPATGAMWKLDNICHGELSAAEVPTATGNETSPILATPVDPTPVQQQ